ncbi:hypothetical protein CH253_08355 [Rhodococcus sp. 06-156-3C]|uniref:ERF family protein n=1 Tax=Rhodococcus sp. 06-156-3C TaxID=2022486 RepID=UPI000B9B304A|nr:ERF family protein [Rhodococcus sp. 06-156-3C]OZD23858.1 hypothetical protein CH253_08355 [Rhodococcus sp. 06-156-3C]
MTEAQPLSVLLPKISAEVGAVKKDDYNQGQKFNFRGIDAVVNACHKAMHTNGVTVVPRLLSVEYVPVTIGRNATPATSVRVIAGYVFHGPAGDTVEALVPAEGNDSADKGTAKAMSVALRTALLQTFMLPTDDVDPDATYEEQVPIHVGLQRQIIAVAQQKGLQPADMAAEFKAHGGTGKLTECDDVFILKDTLEALEGAAGGNESGQ